MRARLALCAAWAACASLLLGCSDGGSGNDASATVPTAQALLGADLLPPDGAVAASSALTADELPPDTTASPDASELPPAS